MSLAALLNLGGGEVILILVLFLILLTAKRLPEITEGFRHGLKEFRKATRALTKKPTGLGADDCPLKPPRTRRRDLSPRRHEFDSCRL
jgi:Sec-independent protein translocase protein TatA